jgi:SsrA-binding protein
VKGFTIIPLSIILSDTGYIKLEIGLGKGKNLYDKSKAIKLRDLDRDLKEMYNIKTPSFKLNHNYPNEKKFQ